MMLFAISDVVWQALIAAGLAIALLWMQQRAAKKVADKVEDVKVDLTTTKEETVGKLDKIIKGNDQIIEVQNGHTERILRLYAVAMRKEADRTGSDVDKEAATKADAELEAHTEGMKKTPGK